jgi:hypothetical protein
VLLKFGRNDRGERSHQRPCFFRGPGNVIGPVFVAASPPLQPTISQVVIPPPPRPAPEAIVERERALHEKHILALYELKPGRRWRH